MDPSLIPGESVGLPWRRMILSGHAKLPQEAAARSIYHILSVVVAVDPNTGVVLDADATLVTAPARQFVRELMVGVNLNDTSDNVLGYVQQYYWGGAKRALLAAIRELYERWAELQSMGQPGKSESSG